MRHIIAGACMLAAVLCAMVVLVGFVIAGAAIWATFALNGWFALAILGGFALCVLGWAGIGFFWELSY